VLKLDLKTTSFQEQTHQTTDSYWTTSLAEVWQLCISRIGLSLYQCYSKTSSLKNKKIKEFMGSASGRRLNCGPAFLVNV
jgi:hypothetical protein